MSDITKARKWVLVKHFDGFPKDSDLKLEEEEISPLENGEVLVEASFWSVDPYMRPYTKRMPAGITMIGTQVCSVIKTRNGEYPLGTRLVGNFGWRDRTKFNPSNMGPYEVKPIPDLGSLSASLALGVIGMPGATAYFGFLNLCEPKSGDVVLVNAAAGAVGSIVGQIAKIKGCKVIGYAGTDDKVSWLKKELGFDYAFNYKTQDLDKTLKEAAPDGVDCYFDNVGGNFSDTVYLNHMKKYGRVSICGSIDSYNDKDGKMAQGPRLHGTILFKEMRVEGFIVTRWAKDWMKAFKEIIQWIKEGKLKYREHVTQGFENMPKAFFGLLKGENTGKAIIKA